MPIVQSYATKYETLLAVGQLGGWEYDVLSKELWCNKSYFNLLGREEAATSEWAKYSIKEIWEDLLHPDDLAKAKVFFADFILNPLKEYAQQFRMLHANGKWVTILSRAMAMRNNEGELTGMIIGTHLDITSIQEISENLVSTQKEFEKSKRQIIKDNAFLKAILNSPKDLFIIAIDKRHCLLGFSDSYLEYATNFLQKQVSIGMNVMEILPEELQTIAKTNYDRALAGESFVVTSNFLAPNGKRVYYENKYGPIIDTHGKILGLTLFSNDVTALKEQQEETRIVDLRYAALFDGAEDAILIADANSGFLVDVNNSACTLFGYTKAEMVGMHQTQLHPPEDLVIVGKLFQEFTKTNSYKSVDVNIINQQAIHKPVRITASAPFRAGKYLFLAAYFKDLTNEKASIEKTLTIQEMLSKAEGIARVGSFEVAIPSGNAVWSDEMFRIVEMSPENELAHRDLFTKLVCEDDRNLYDKWVQKASTFQGEIPPIHIKIRTLAGNLKNVILSGVAYRNAQQEIHKFIGVIKDNTARIATLESLKLQNEKLREIAWAQSHLVRGPLADILGITKIIHGNLATEDEKLTLLKELHVSAIKLDNVIKDVVNNTGSFEENFDHFG